MAKVLSSYLTFFMFESLRTYWKTDLISAVNVALVALPLGLGIAGAGGIPPISGVLSAIIGALVCSFIRGSHVAVNGPGNGMIAVVISAMLILNPYGAVGFNYLLAAFVMSGGFMILLGLLKMGRLGDNFPSMVVMGLLAGIGIIIMLKQLKPGFGADVAPGFNRSFFNSFHLPETVIFLGSIGILIAYEFTQRRLIKFIPGPVWVLIFALPIVFIFNMPEELAISLVGMRYETGSHFFVNVPDVFGHISSFSDLVTVFPHPDFGIIDTWGFWTIVMSVTLVGSLESLLSAKAVERLDPLGRKVNMNKDLMALGLGTIVSGLIGGMPVNTVIARSSISINSGSKSSWANFFQGVLLVIALIFLTEYINDIPYAALAAILLFTGFKLTKYKIYRDAYLHGKEQLVILLLTLGVTYFFGLITGVLVGMLFNLAVHIYYFEGPFSQFFLFLFNPILKTVESKDHRVFVRLYGILNFLNIQPFESLLKSIPVSKNLTIDFSRLKLVDLTVLEFVRDFANNYRRHGGTLESVGLDAHYTTSTYPHSLHFLSSNRTMMSAVTRKTLRQTRMDDLAQANNWKLDTRINWETPELNQFAYFIERPIEYTSNIIFGNYPDLNVQWEISDMTFDSRNFIEVQEKHTTEHLIRLPIELPQFILDKEFLYDKIFDMIEQNDIDFEDYPVFSKSFVLTSPDGNEEVLKAFFDDRLIRFFEDHDVYHIECIGQKLVIFRNSRLASVEEIKELIQYSYELCQVLLNRQNNPH